MNYNQHYLKLINTRKSLNRTKDDTYYEKHHVLPKCLGGTNDKENLVLLTPKEHFIAHLLLTRMYEGKIKTKLCYAFLRMCTSNQKRKISASQYESAKKLLSKNCRGINNPFFGKGWINKGKHLSDETKQKLRIANLGKISPMKGKKMSLPSWNLGGTISEEHKTQIKKTLSKIIIEYDLEGNKLNEYIGVPEASKKTGLHKTTIYLCCHKKTHFQTKGKTFRFDGEIFDYTPYKKGQHKRKSIIKNDKGILTEYTSITEASLINNISVCAISHCLQKRSKTAGGFIWEFKS